MSIKISESEWQIEPCAEGLEIHNGYRSIARIPIDYGETRDLEIIKGNSELLLNSPKLLDHLRNIIEAQYKPGGTLSALNGAIANAKKDLEKLNML